MRRCRMVTSRVWLPQNRRSSFGNDGSKVRAFRRSRGPLSAGPRAAFSGSYLSMAALLHQQGVELPWRLQWRSAKRFLEGLRQVLPSALLHEALKMDSGSPEYWVRYIS